MWALKLRKRRVFYACGNVHVYVWALSGILWMLISENLIDKNVHKSPNLINFSIIIFNFLWPGTESRTDGQEAMVQTSIYVQLKTWSIAKHMAENDAAGLMVLVELNSDVV